jgi:hypothetical protein
VSGTSMRQPHQVLLDLLAVMRTVNELPPFTLTKNQSVRNSDYRKFLKRMGWQDAVDVDGYLFIGMGDAVLAALAGERVELRKLAVSRIPHSGKPQELLEMYGISRTHIAGAVRQLVARSMQARG